MTVPQMRRRELALDGRVIRLTQRETDVAAVLLAASPVRFLELGEIVEAIWLDPFREPAYPEANLRIYVHRLRRLGVPIESRQSSGRAHRAAYRIPASSRAPRLETIERLAA